MLESDVNLQAPAAWKQSPNKRFATGSELSSPRDTIYSSASTFLQSIASFFNVSASEANTWTCLSYCVYGSSTHLVSIFRHSSTGPEVIYARREPQRLF